MFLLKDVKVSAALCGTLFVLAACSSASFPEITEEDSSAISSEESGKILKEGKSLVGDARQVFENQRRQSRLEYKGIHLIGKDFVHKTNAPKEKADRHHEEDGDCGVEAENQMFQGEAPPFLDFDRR